jgi:GTP-binding protein
MFVDEVDITVTAGAGGRGAISFRREKFIPKGGPDGGDGGAGGSVYLVASPHHNTLVNYRFHPTFVAQRGAHGQGALRTGKSGKPLELAVPPGTVVYRIADDGTLEQIADLVEPGDKALVARGGRGGRGNARFVSAVNRAPRRADPGEPGESLSLRLRLKLLADVGLVGFPNVGKSTLIARVSAARPKIADYPFTTLVPNLGVVSLSGDRSFVVADVPGLIEGAHEGRGLGHRFLSHVERTAVLLHVVDVSEASLRDPVDDLDVIRAELAHYTPNAETVDPDALPLAARPQMVAANRIDILNDASRLDALRAHAESLGLPFFAISAVTGEGVDALLEALWPHVEAGRTARQEAARIATEAAAATAPPGDAADAAPSTPPARRTSRSLAALAASRRPAPPPDDPPTDG